jgi:hypothetical protein
MDINPILASFQAILTAEIDNRRMTERIEPQRHRGRREKNYGKISVNSASLWFYSDNSLEDIS